MWTGEKQGNQHAENEERPFEGNFRTAKWPILLLTTLPFLTDFKTKRIGGDFCSFLENVFTLLTVQCIFFSLWPLFSTIGVISIHFNF